MCKNEDKAELNEDKMYLLQLKNKSTLLILCWEVNKFSVRQEKSTHRKSERKAKIQITY